MNCAENVSFPSVVSGNPTASRNQSVDFRTLMITTQNEELTEEKEKEKRKKNVIVHGFENSDEKNTEKLVATLFQDIGVGNKSDLKWKRETTYHRGIQY